MSLHLPWHNATNEIQLTLTLQLTSGENVTLQTKVYPKNLAKDLTYKNFYQTGWSITVHEKQVLKCSRGSPLRPPINKRVLQFGSPTRGSSKELVIAAKARPAKPGQESISFFKNRTWISRFHGNGTIEIRRKVGRDFFLKNSKGISVLFLFIAMLLMVMIGYVFSYLIPTKQKSVVFPIQSTQAFFLAQSGVEFAVRLPGINTLDNACTTRRIDRYDKDFGSRKLYLDLY